MSRINHLNQMDTVKSKLGSICGNPNYRNGITTLLKQNNLILSPSDINTPMGSIRNSNCPANVSTTDLSLSTNTFLINNDDVFQSKLYTTK